MTSSTQTTGAVGGVAVPDIPTQLFVGGEWRDASDGATFDVVAPASEEHLATVAAASEDDVDAAVRAARRQSDGGAWSRLTGAERGVRGEDRNDHVVSPTRAACAARRHVPGNAGAVSPEQDRRTDG